MCSVATQTAITSSAPCLIYSQTLIRHMYINTLWCTSITPCPHGHNNTFTIVTLHLTAASPYYPYSLSSQTSRSNFTIQSDVQCCQAWFKYYLKVLLFFFLKVQNGNFATQSRKLLVDNLEHHRISAC